MLPSNSSVSLIQSIPASLVDGNPKQMYVKQFHCLSSIHDFKANETIFYQGGDSNHLFEVIEGVVKLYKLTQHGRCQITGFRHPGHLLGLEWAGTWAQTAESVTKAKIRRYPRAEIERLLDLDPTLRECLMTALSRELAAAQDQMLLLGSRSAMEKLASFLLRHSEHTEDRGEEISCICMPMRRRDIADYISVSRETVSRLITILKNRKIISLEIPDRRIVVLDKIRLFELSEDGVDI